MDTDSFSTTAPAVHTKNFIIQFIWGLWVQKVLLRIINLLLFDKTSPPQKGRGNPPCGIEKRCPGGCLFAASWLLVVERSSGGGGWRGELVGCDQR